MRKTISGFTIVELLIVIVVIGILAIITVVAYSNVQQRAKFTQQASNMEQLVHALRLYRADGGSMTDGVAGAVGQWYGGCDGVYSGTTKSMRQTLKDSGHLPNDFTANCMIAPCTSTTDNRQVILSKFDPIPLTSPSDQIAPTICNSGSFTAYTDPTQQYKMNYAKVVD